MLSSTALIKSDNLETTKMKIQLRFKNSDPGFCRDYFTYEYNGRRRLACIQQSGRDRYELLSCTSDGEPEARPL